MKLILGILWYFLVAAVRLVLWVIGWFLVPISLIGDGAKQTPQMFRMWADAANTPDVLKQTRWEMYKWWAWRNPTPGWIGKWQQPIPEVMPNPDETVRNLHKKSDSRCMQHEYYWEYWYLRRIDWSIRGKHYKYFEIRIGWKFVDGNKEFFPTLQFGPRSS